MPVEGGTGRGGANANRSNGNNARGNAARVASSAGRAGSRRGEPLPSLQPRGDALDEMRRELASRHGVGVGGAGRGAARQGKAQPQRQARQGGQRQAAASSRRGAAEPEPEPEELVGDDLPEEEEDIGHEELEREADGLEPDLPTEADDELEEGEEPEPEDEEEPEPEEGEGDEEPEEELDDEAGDEEADGEEDDEEDDPTDVDEATLALIRDAFKGGQVGPQGGAGGGQGSGKTEASSAAAGELPELEDLPESKLTDKLVRQLEAMETEPYEALPVLVQELRTLREYLGKVRGVVSPIAGELKRRREEEEKRARAQLRQLTDSWFDLYGRRAGSQTYGDSRKGLTAAHIARRKAAYDLAKALQDRVGADKLSSPRALAVAVRMLDADARGSRGGRGAGAGGGGGGKGAGARTAAGARGVARRPATVRSVPAAEGRKIPQTRAELEREIARLQRRGL